jgi:hypothetical protein
VTENKLTQPTVSAPIPAKPEPAANLMSFDDEKWMEDDDAEWESIDTKHK